MDQTNPLMGEHRLHRLFVCAQAEFSRADAAAVLAAALLEVLAGHVLPGCGCGLISALAVFKNTVVASTQPEARRACPNHEWLQVRVCESLKPIRIPRPAHDAGAQQKGSACPCKDVDKGGFSGASWALGCTPASLCATLLLRQWRSL